MDQEIVLSPPRHAELVAELENLVQHGRPAIAERIRQARALGDLSENFDYHDAKRQQGFLEGRISTIKKMLEIAQVAEHVSGGDTVGIGSTVRVYDAEFDEEIEYKLVGVLEADPSNGMISNTSPVGKALLGKKVGDTVDVPIPAGKATYKVVDIR
jgi:transcription elongation factor GreA